MDSMFNKMRFQELMLESITGQWETFDYYKVLCKKEKIGLTDLQHAVENEEYFRIPTVITTAFKKSKKLVNELNNLSVEGIFQVSSSTSGDPSFIYTSENERKQILNNYITTFGIKDVSKAIAFSPSERILAGLSKKSAYMGKSSIARMKFAIDAALQHYDEMIFTVDLDMFRTIPSMVFRGRPVIRKYPLEKVVAALKIAEKNRSMIVIGGIALLLFPYIDEMKDEAFHFESNLHIVLSGGGYSGKKGSLRGKKIVKSELADNICRKFSLDREILSTNFKDIYGCTESSATSEGFWSDERGDFVFNAWPGSKIFIVDPATEKPLKKGRGQIKIVAPYSDGKPSAANVSILQCDLATIVKANEDYSISQFTEVGRLESSTQEGCAFKAGELADAL